MKELLVSLLLVTQFSCISKAQENDTTTQILTTDSLQTDTLSLLFAGDLMQHQRQINAARTATGGYDYSSYFEYVKDEIQSADFAIANLEVTLGGKPYKGYPAFSAPDEYLTAIHNAGFNVLITANNHSLDRGRKGLERTIQLIDSLKIPHAGTYLNAEERENKYPLLLEKKGFRIAILNYTYGTNGIPVTPPNIVNYIDTTIISKDIEASKTLNPDAIIACMHWGIEYQSLPDKRTEVSDLLAASKRSKSHNRLSSACCATYRSSRRQSDKREASGSIFIGKLYFQYVRPSHGWRLDGQNGISKR